MPKIAVYGTLKKGFHNHRYINGAKFLGNFKTAPVYKLFCNGHYPYLVKSDQGTEVEVEVYEITKDQLQGCDYLEGHPQYYKRTPIKIDGVGDVEIYIYQHEVRKSCKNAGSCWNGPVEN